MYSDHHGDFSTKRHQNAFLCHYGTFSIDHHENEVPYYGSFFYHLAPKRVSLFTMVILPPDTTKCDLVLQRLFSFPESPQTSFPFNHGYFPSGNNQTVLDSFFQHSDFFHDQSPPSRFPLTFDHRSLSTNHHQNAFLFYHGYLLPIINAFISTPLMFIFVCAFNPFILSVKYF